MRKLIKELFPIFDYLYIFQTLEYQPLAFFKWFTKHPFARNLQHKHHLVITNKVLILAFLSILFLTFSTFFLSLSLFGTILLLPIIFLLLLFLSPIFIIFSQIFLLPFETYNKNQLTDQAKEKISHLPNLKVVAITGSFAKTSVKDMLYTLLWKKYEVIKTPKSFNTKVSIARTILDLLKNSTQVFIVEMDAYYPGEIDQLAKMAKPEIGLITSIAPQHLERFGSMEKLAMTQFELADNLPSTGILFLNSTDPEVVATASSLSFPTKRKSYGFDKSDDIYASDIKQQLEGLSFTLHQQKSSIQIFLPLYGKHHVLNFLAAASIALQLGLTLKEIQTRAKKILPTPHRLEIKKQGHITVIDNSYNTNPIVSASSLQLLKNYPGKQKILITPGLVELGYKHAEENQIFAQKAAKVADQIIIVGENARADLIKGLEDAQYPQNQIHQVPSLEKGLEQLSQIAQPETVVLLENDLSDQYF